MFSQWGMGASSKLNFSRVADGRFVSREMDNGNSSKLPLDLGELGNLGGLGELGGTWEDLGDLGDLGNLGNLGELGVTCGDWGT